MYFFHEITEIPSGEKEKYFHTCQWEVPTTWDRDMMLEVGSHGGQSDNVKSTAGAYDSNAFEEPGETWVPEPGENRAVVQQEFKTPGIRATISKKMEDYEHETELLVAKAADDSIAAHASSAGGSSAIPPAGDDRSGLDAVDPNRVVDNVAKELLRNDELMKALCRRLGCIRRS